MSAAADVVASLECRSQQIVSVGAQAAMARAGDSLEMKGRDVGCLGRWTGRRVCVYCPVAQIGSVLTAS